ncbi:MAG: hypothetical protein QOH14_2344 [Pseudonocardiales bacterium]|jgi:hypothetical protein|nr:hypothetical protein [Pseudonocardiales bacterium]
MCRDDGVTMAVRGIRAGSRRHLLRWSGGGSGGPVRVPFTHRVGVAVHDVLFVLLTIGVFVFLALVAKGAEKL